MSALTDWPWPPEYSPMRLLAEGRGGIVSLARNTQWELVALKLLRLAEGIEPEAALARHQKLLALTQRPGLLPMLACGLTADQHWLWESLVTADCLSGQPASVGDDYTPATYRHIVIQQGSLTAAETIRVGLAISEGLAALHQAGLVHRDVKPGNLFRVRNLPMLGDFGLISAPGGKLDFLGTEGFAPVDGPANQTADLFALGKTLYELWTGCDRLEFPTIPKHILKNSEWKSVGAALNDVLLQACAANPAERYQKAELFANALAAAAKGYSRTLSRRRWLVAGATAAGVALCAGAVPWFLRRRPVMRWRLCHRWDHLPEGWGENRPLLDVRRQCVFQFNCHDREKLVYRVDLTKFHVSHVDFHAEEVKDAWQAILHPEEQNLWFAENGRGPVWRVNPETGESSLVGGHEADSTEDYSGAAYWNPLTRRLGSFGGYGELAVHNWRWEFNVTAGRWIQIEPNDPKREPRCRWVHNLIPMDDAGNFLLFGGGGNRTGRQGERDPGFKVWDTHFHQLGDVWQLNLANNQWQSIVPAPGLELPRFQSCAWLARQKTLVVIHAHAADAQIGLPPETHILRINESSSFEEIESVGEFADVRTSSFLTALPNGKSMLAFLPDGIYELTLHG